jgi:hypothetical protein
MPVYFLQLAGMGFNLEAWTFGLSLLDTVFGHLLITFSSYYVVLDI